MGDAVAALAQKVAVRPYFRVQDGKVVRVDAHVRMQDLAKVGRFTLPATPIEASRAEVASIQKRSAGKLERLEALSDEDFKALHGSLEAFAGLLERRPDLEDLRYEPLSTALWRERSGFKDKASFEKRFPWDASILGVARGETKWKAALIRTLNKTWKAAAPERTDPKQRALIEREAAAVFQEPKIHAIAERFGEPDLFVAFNLARVGEAGRTDTPVAEYRYHNKVVFYESSSLEGTDDERLESKPFDAFDFKPSPGQPVSHVTKSVKGVMRHEYGHMVSDGIVSSSGTFNDTWRRLKVRDEERMASGQAMTISERISYYNDLPKKISFYAFENEREGFAEAFAIVTHPDFDRGDYRGAFGEELLDAMLEELREQGVNL